MGVNCKLSLWDLAKSNWNVYKADNAYNIDHLSAKGFCCKTNLQSNTAFRGFGGPQSMLITETWIELVADRLGVDPVTIRDKNLYEEGQTTHFNMALENCTLRRLIYFVFIRFKNCLRLTFNVGKILFLY